MNWSPSSRFRWLGRWRSSIPHPYAIARIQRMVEDHYITVELRRRQTKDVVAGDRWLNRDSEDYRTSLREELGSVDRIGWRAVFMTTMPVEWIARREINIWPAPTVTTKAA